MKIRTGITLAAMIAAAAVSGCAGGQKNSGKGIIKEVTTTDQYPLSSSDTITWYCSLGGLSDVVSSMNESEFAKEFIKQTGVNVEFQHPTEGSAEQSFNLMVASGDYPDIIEYSWGSYSGGLSKAVEDNIAVPLNDIVEKVSPNFKKLLEEHPEIKRDITTSSGEIVMYPFYRGDDILCTYYGPMVRGDLLDDMSAEVPETIDEWENMLRAFKDKVDVPCIVDLTPSKMRGVDMFLGAYNVDSDLYIDSGKIKYGPSEDGFRSWVEKMASWYNEGLIDRELANLDSKRTSSLVINGQAGAVLGYNGSNFGTWLPTFREKNPGKSLVPTKFPSAKKGERPQFGHKEPRILGIGAVISTDCKNPEIAARLLDFAYTEKGHNLYNFGIEGVTYEMKDGIPTYTSKITNSEKEMNLSIGQALSMYSRVTNNGPFVQDKNYITQYYRDETQKKALEMWSDNSEEEHYLPALQYSADESKEISKIMSDIRTYVDENVLKMIMGVTPLSEYDTFVSRIDSMGIDKVLDITQKAYDRYMAK